VSESGVGASGRAGAPWVGEQGGRGVGGALPADAARPLLWEGGGGVICMHCTAIIARLVRG
jgi:hypothetical protein